MKLHLYSDIHKEFETKNNIFMPPGGDVLILAGDVCVADDFNQDTLAWFQEVSERYEQVFYVLGNHEHYHGDLTASYWILNEELPENVTILNNTSLF